MDADGDAVITWASFGQDGNGYAVMARRYSSTGAASSEFQVNEMTGGFQFRPWVEASASGAFVVTWQGHDGASNGIFARRFSSTGAAIGGEFQVNTYSLYQQTRPALAADPAGNFVVVWQQEDLDGGDDDVFGRRFSNNGVAVASEFRVNTFTTGVQSNPVIAVEDDGDFVVVWQRLDPAYHDVFAQRFSSSGTTVGGEFRVNLVTSLHQRYPLIDTDAAGGFIVTWQSNWPDADGSGEAVIARRFSSAGAAIGGEFRVNEYSPNAQVRPWIRVEPDGEFLVVWTSPWDDPFESGGIIGRLFTADAVPLNREFQINSYTPSIQNRPAVAAGGGRFVVAWQSLSQDGEGYGVFAQRLASILPLDVDGNFVVDALTDTILALRYVFGFRGNTLITGAVGPNCTRCDAPSIEAYLSDLAN